MKALLLAAGQGTRLRPHTDDRPKPMVDLGGKPVVAHILGWLVDQGVRDVAINLHYKPAVLRAYVRDGSEFGVSVRYSEEPQLLGSAGALVPLQAFFADGDPFVVCYGDVLTDLDLRPVLAQHEATRADATVVLVRVEDPTRCGIVELADDQAIRRIVEKPSADEVFTDWANAGIYVLRPSVLGAIPDPCPVPFDAAAGLFPRMLELGYRLFGFRSDSWTLDIGSPERLEEARRVIAGRQTDRFRVTSAC